MQSLIPEIEKIAAYSRKREIDKRDIDAVASPTPSAIIFNLTDALAAKDLDRAINISEQLKSSGQESIPTLAMIAKQFRQLYSAKLMHSEREIMELWGIHHPFRARLIINSARSMKLDWIKYAITLCAETDISLKTTSNANEIEVMIAKLAAYREVNNAEN